MKPRVPLVDSNRAYHLKASSAPKSGTATQSHQPLGRTTFKEGKEEGKAANIIDKLGLLSETYSQRKVSRGGVVVGGNGRAL